MDKKIGTGAGLAIIAVVAGTMTLLTLRMASQFRPLVSEVPVMPLSVKVDSAVVPPAVKISTETRPVETNEFSRSKHHLSFKYPVVFYRQAEKESTTAYTTYFTSKDIKNDYSQLGQDDVQLSVVVKKGETPKQDDMQQLEQLGVVKIEDTKTAVIDGLAASQYLLRVLRSDPGCDLRTDFGKDGMAYRVSLFTIGGHCEALQRFMPEYATLLANFHIEK